MSICRNLTLSAAQRACLQDQELTQTPADISRCLGLYEDIQGVFQPALSDEIPASGVSLTVNVERNSTAPQTAFTASLTDPSTCLERPEFQNALNPIARANLNRSLMAIRGYELWFNDNPSVALSSQQVSSGGWEGFLHYRRGLGQAVPANVTAPAQLWATVGIMRYLNQDPAIKSYINLFDLRAENQILVSAFNTTAQGLLVFPAEYFPRNGAVTSCTNPASNLGFGLRAAACVDMTRSINTTWATALGDCREGQQAPQSETPWGTIALGAAAVGGTWWLTRRTARAEFQSILDERLAAVNRPPPATAIEESMYALEGRALVAGGRRAEEAALASTNQATAEVGSPVGNAAPAPAPEVEVSAQTVDVESLVPRTDLEALELRYQARLTQVARDFEERLRTLQQAQSSRVADAERTSFARGLAAGTVLSEEEIRGLRIQIDRLERSLSLGAIERARERQTAARALMGYVHTMNQRLTLERMNSALLVEALRDAVEVQHTILELLEDTSEISLSQDAQIPEVGSQNTPFRATINHRVSPATRSMWTAIGYVYEAVTAQEEILLARGGPHTRVRDVYRGHTPPRGINTAVDTHPDGTPVPPAGTRPAQAEVLPTHDDAVMVLGEERARSLSDMAAGGPAHGEGLAAAVRGGPGTPAAPTTHAPTGGSGGRSEGTEIVNEAIRAFESGYHGDFLDRFVPEGLRRALGEHDMRRGR